MYDGDDLEFLGGVGDCDGDDWSGLEEFLADSDPFDRFDCFRIVEIALSDTPEDSVTVEWTSSPRRLYDINTTADLATGFAVEIGDTLPSNGEHNDPDAYGIIPISIADSPMSALKSDSHLDPEFAEFC